MSATHHTTSSPRAFPARLMLAALVALFAASPAMAGHDTPEGMAGAARVLSIFVICIVPIVGVVVFWMVHVLPEKVAHKRNHPQTEAIQVLCLLSLLFGGLLWPLAWLWAYTKPVLYKMAYGTDQGDRHAAPVAAPAADDVREGIARVRADLERLAARQGAPRELEAIRERLAALDAPAAGPAGGAR